MALFIPRFCHKALDDISNSNMYNLVRQISKPCVDLTIRHWPRILVGGVGLMNLIKNREFLWLYFRDFLTLIPGLFSLDLFEPAAIAGLTGIALFIFMMPCLLMGDSIFGVVLLFRYNDKEPQLGHVQRLLSYWKIRCASMFLEYIPLIHRLCPSLFNYLKSMSNDFFSHLVDDLASETPGYYGGLATMVTAEILFYWGLRTLIKDLKGEPRSWWGGRLEVQTSADEKDS